MPESTPKLVAYVSDERYVALPDVILEFEGDAGSFEARSRATGAVHVVMPSGTYKVTLQKPGFGAKSVRVEIASSGTAPSFPTPIGRPARLRLAQMGQGRRKGRVPRALRRALSIESLAVRFQEGADPQPRLVRRARPAGHDANHARRRLFPDRCRLEQIRLRQPRAAPVCRCPRAVGPLLFSCAHGPGRRVCAFPGSSRPQNRRRPSPCSHRTSPGTPTTISAAAATT